MGRSFRRMARRVALAMPRPMRSALRALPGAARLRRTLLGDHDRPLGPDPRRGSLRPVVCLPTWSRWGVMNQRPHHLMSALAAAGHPVFFVQPDLLEARTHGGVHLVPAIRDVPGRDVILYIHFAPLRDLIGRFDNPVVVYDIYDDLSIFSADEGAVPVSGRVSSHHLPLIRSSSLVTVSDTTLMERHRGERSDLLLVANGVDYASFSAAYPVPEDLPRRTGPIIGYHGMVSYWFDFAALHAAAKQRPDWQFVLVGPVDPRVAPEVELLGQHSNVTLLGERPSDSIAAYVGHFDVEVIWFEVTPLTEAVNPLKMYEAMAAGVPVVAPPLPACQATPGVRIAAAADFIPPIAAALAARGSEAEILRDTAASADWSARVVPLLELLDARGLRRVPL